MQTFGIGAHRRGIGKHKKKFSPGAHARWESRTLHVIGDALLACSLLLIPSVILTYLDHCGTIGSFSMTIFDSVMPFLLPAVVGLVLSLFLIISFRPPATMHPSDGLLTIFVMWMVLFIFGMMPYILSGFSFVDALFETVSGFSTTGATIMTDYSAGREGLFLWRAITHWIGGIVVVIMFMLIIPMVVSGGRGLLKNEMSGSGTGNLSMRLRDAAKQFIIVYTILTTIFAVVLILMGVVPFEAVCISLSAVATGGFASTADSINGYSIFVKIVITLFMLMSATNFYVHYTSFYRRSLKAYTRNEELRVMIGIYAIMTVVIVSVIALSSGYGFSGDIPNQLVDVWFTVVSIGTSTGFTTVSAADAWPSMAMLLMIPLMFIGGSAGSTAGGIKISRAIVIFRAMTNELRRMVHPNAFYSVKFNGSHVDDEDVHGATMVAFIFLVTIIVSSAVLATVMNVQDAVFSSVSLLGGTGVGIDSYSSSYASLPGWTKVFCSILMYLGRMEIAAALVILMPGFWVEIIGPSKIREFKNNRKNKRRAKSVKGGQSDSDDSDAKKAQQVPSGKSDKNDAELDGIDVEEEKDISHTSGDADVEDAEDETKDGVR